MKARTVVRRREEDPLCDPGSGLLLGGRPWEQCEDNQWDGGKKNVLFLEGHIASEIWKWAYKYPGFYTPMTINMIPDFYSKSAVHKMRMQARPDRHRVTHSLTEPHLITGMKRVRKIRIYDFVFMVS